MLLAAGHSWRPDHGFGQWTGAAITIVVLHVVAAGVALITWQSVELPALPPAAIMIELAPLPVAPAAPVTQAAQETPKEEVAQPVFELPLPEIDIAPPVIPQPELTLPIPEIDMVPPTIADPEIVLPKPAPEKPKELVAEKPKEKPKDKPKEKPKDKPKEQAKEKPKPKPEEEPAPALDGPLQPSQQAAAAAAPARQAAVPAAPSATDLARIADAKANWQGLLFAHLEKHRRYPKRSERRHEEGVASLFIRMDRLGNVLSYNLITGSGYEALDEEAMALIKRAEPLPPLPAEISNDVFEFNFPLVFRLK